MGIALRTEGWMHRICLLVGAFVFLLGIAPPPSMAAIGAVPYDIVYVRAPRYGDAGPTKWPEVFNPINVEPGSDLVLLRPDGSQEVLHTAGNGAVVDPVMSFDAKFVYFSYFPDVRLSASNYQRSYAPNAGADIYKLELATRNLTRLTQQKWEPALGAAKWSTDHLTNSGNDTFTLGYGIFNLGPCPLPGGKLMFVSSRDGYLPNKSFTFPNLRLYIMDDDGSNVEPVGHINMGSALHPTILKDERVMFSSYEGQGARDQRLWSLWSIWPDGTQWEPLMSAFNRDRALHFQTQLSDGRVAVMEYYNLNNSGFGALLAFNGQTPRTSARFGSANPEDASNPEVRRGLWWFDENHPYHKQPRYEKYRFSPPGLVNLTAFTHSADEAASFGLTGEYAGKVTHPAAAPNNDVLLVWSPGPANLLNRPINTPRVDGGIYLLRNGQSLTDHTQLVKIINDPNFNEQQPRAVVPYSAIYGVTEPVNLPRLANDGTLHTALPKGTPFGLIGTSSFLSRDTTPNDGRPGTDAYNGLEKFNTRSNDENPNWFTQGADAGKYTNADIYAVRIVAMEAVADKSYGPIYPSYTAFRAHTERERLRVLGEIVLKKDRYPGVNPNDTQGNRDSSFLAKIPADTPFTFQTLDRDGLVLNMAQTWHMVRPGEVRTNCGGCHAHSKPSLPFEQTIAGRPGYQPTDLTKYALAVRYDRSGTLVQTRLNTPMLDVEYRRDIKPIFQRACVQCHSKTGRQEAKLALDDDTLTDGYEGTYLALAWDQDATRGIKPVIGTWRQENASRYVRKFQSRRSLLAWKVFGKRLDGWTNADHPTESVPGDATTLPAGADANEADIDFVGTIMPPPGSGVAPLTDEEKLTIARWIDLGAPSDHAEAQYARYGWFSDELKPTLYLPPPLISFSTNPAQMAITFSAHDHYSGIDWPATSVKANFEVDDLAAGAELAQLFTAPDGGVRTYALRALPPLGSTGEITVRVRDMQGNVSERVRKFTVR